MDINAFIKRNILKIVLIPLGGLAGFLYWRFIGCESGTCPIKSIWYWSTLYGLIFGYLISDIILSYTKRKKDKQTEGTIDEGSKV
jgi:hypothetical protein